MVFSERLAVAIVCLSTLIAMLVVLVFVVSLDGRITNFELAATIVAAALGGIALYGVDWVLTRRPYWRAEGSRRWIDPSEELFLLLGCYLVFLAVVVAMVGLSLSPGVARVTRSPPPPVQPGIAFGWTELLPDDLDARRPRRQIYRVVLNDSRAACPEIRIGKHTYHSMRPRRSPWSKAFPARVCEVAADANGEVASVEKTTLRPRPKTLRRIVIIGDTGCRIIPAFQQDCRHAWAFATVARSIRQATQAKPPDLIVHVGDYHYREAECLPAFAGCAGSPWGDTWATWRADFFEPAKPILDLAPWVFVRGTHESCDRAGRGWLYLLYAGDLRSADCIAAVPPYWLDFGTPAGGLRLFVVDVADVDGRHPGPTANVWRTIAAATALPSPFAREWLLLHRPLGTFYYDRRTNTARTPIERMPEYFTSQPPKPAVLRPELCKFLFRSPGSRVAIAGDTHIFATFDDLPMSCAGRYGGDSKRVLQLIAGNSGTELDYPARPQDTLIPPPARMKRFNYAFGGGDKNVTTHVAKGFGFALLDLVGDAWRIQVCDQDGVLIASGLFAGYLKSPPRLTACR